MERVLEKMKNRVDETDRGILNADFTKDEIMAAIGGLNRGKSPGAHGLVGELYITLKNEVSSLLCKFFNYVWQGGEVPPDFVSGIVIYRL